MAKRKRLQVPTDTIPSDLETKSAFPAPRARMPIADVAGEVAGRAALEEVAREMTAAEEEGRVVKKLPLEQIVLRHLARDRMVLDEEEMAALMASLEARGQQTPIEVLESRFPVRVLRYGLRRGSGGDGQRAGGDGLIREYQFDAPAHFTLLTERRSHAPWGIAGGGDASSGLNLLNGRALPAKCEHSLAVGDRLRIETLSDFGYDAFRERLGR